MQVKSSRVHAVLAVSLMLCLVAPVTAEPRRSAVDLPDPRHDAVPAAEPVVLGGFGRHHRGLPRRRRQPGAVLRSRARRNHAGLREPPRHPRRPAARFAQLGFTSPGRYLDRRISYADVRTQTAANRPVETRVGYRSGGGHTHVLYGYDTSGSWVSWGDPGPAKRYNWSTYGYYTHNSSFTWTHTLTGIAR